MVAGELFQWVVRDVERDLAEAVVRAARGSGRKTGELLNDLLRHWLDSGGAAKVEGPGPGQLDLVDLVERLERLEGRVDELGAQSSQAAQEARQGRPKRAGEGKKREVMSEEKAAELDQLLRDGELNNVEIGERMGISSEWARRRRIALGLPQVTRRRKPKRPKQA